jgi:hypothetical protein
MLRRSAFQDWPSVMATEAMANKEIAPALSHWNTAKPGVASLWPSSPQWLTRYVNEIRSSHASSVLNAARSLRKRLMQRD